MSSSTKEAESKKATAIDEIVKLRRLSNEGSRISKKRCIYRVPKRLRQHKEEVYTPVVVSIGPFHHGNERLLPMEILKLRHLQSFIDRPQNCCKDLTIYVEIIKDKESRIRDSYAEDIPMTSDEFVKMVLIDAVFIIDLFCFGGRLDIMPAVKYVQVPRDLMLLENQLPFFILEELFSAAFKPQEPRSFLDIACERLRVNKSRVKVDTITKQAVCFHLLDLQRSQCMPSHHKMETNTNKDVDEKLQQGIRAHCYLPRNFNRSHYLPFEQNTNILKPKELGARRISCPSAMSLHEAGVKFCASVKPCGLLDLHFDKRKGILTIPSLQVQDQTDPFFRNMIAFEQCHYLNRNYMADYLCFMGCLINTREDVRLLAKANIIQNWLGSEKDVVCLVNSLTSRLTVVPGLYHYASITEQLNAHCYERLNSYTAALKCTYLKHPWAFFSVIYALILVLLTVR